MANNKLTHLSSKSQQKPLFFFESGIHAREWLSIASNIFFIEKVSRIQSRLALIFLINHYYLFFKLIQKFLKNDDTVIKILKKYELHFLPVMNPVS